jgi:hypothetical protein
MTAVAIFSVVGILNAYMLIPSAFCLGWVAMGFSSGKVPLSTKAAHRIIRC